MTHSVHSFVLRKEQGAHKRFYERGIPLRRNVFGKLLFAENFSRLLNRTSFVLSESLQVGLLLRTDLRLVLLVARGRARAQWWRRCFECRIKVMDQLK